MAETDEHETAAARGAIIVGVLVAVGSVLVSQHFWGWVVGFGLGLIIFPLSVFITAKL